MIFFSFSNNTCFLLLEIPHTVASAWFSLSRPLSFPAISSENTPKAQTEDHVFQEGFQVSQARFNAATTWVSTLSTLSLKKVSHSIKNSCSLAWCTQIYGSDRFDFFIPYPQGPKKSNTTLIFLKHQTNAD